MYLLLLAAVGLFLYMSLARRPGSSSTAMPIADVADMISAGQISAISVKDDRVFGTIQESGQEIQSRKESDSGLVETLTNLGVTPQDLETGHRKR